MRILIFSAVLAAASPLSLCERRNAAVCSTTPGFECDAQQYCQIAPGAEVGTCLPIECGDGAKVCPGDRPLCITGQCRACVSDGECLAASPAAPVCLDNKCVGCRSNASCQDRLNPVCDLTSHTCRPCQLHTECASGVCAKDDSFASLPAPASPISKGMCASVDQVLEVDTACGGSCSLQTQLAAATPARPYVRVKSLSTSLTITVPPPSSGLPTHYVVGPQADVPPTSLAQKPPINFSSAAGPTLMIGGNTRITLEGVVLTRSDTGVECRGTTPADPAKLRLLRSYLSANGTAIKVYSGCELTVEQSWIGRGPPGAFAGEGSNDLAILVDSAPTTVLNSVFWGNGRTGVFGGIKLQGALASSTQLRIVNSTFAENLFPDARNTLAIDCTAPTTGNVAIVNSLFLNAMSPTPGWTYIHANCRPANAMRAIASNEGGLLATDSLDNVDASQTFFDLSGGNLHLRPGAPAMVRSGGVSQFTDPQANPVTIPAEDFDGKPRKTASQGISLGAYQP